jgi:glycosyltransferase involved in cell wall biosynthesis
MIYADQRWMGEHGIGRFARRVLAHLDYRAISLSSHPTSPLDPLRLTRAVAKLTAGDLFYSPGYNAPLFCPAPFVFTVHDLNHIDRPENSSPLKRLYYATVLKRACHRAAFVLTNSEFSRGRILAWSGVPSAKVVNVGCGVDPEYSPAPAPRLFPFPYLLCVSNRKGHKNELRTVEAFARAGLPVELKLVFTGAPAPELSACIQRHRMEARIHFAGVVPDAQMPALYRNAESLVFVSLYEGFGLPVLEAMACGTPAVTSNTTALREVAAHAALLVDPTSVEQIAAAMQRIMGDASLREELRSNGLTQATRYSWESTAAKVRQVLESVSPEALSHGRDHPDGAISVSTAKSVGRGQAGPGQHRG